MKKSTMIVGTRTYDNYPEFKKKVDEWLNYNVNLNEDIIEIVSGGARGVDSLAERLTNEEGFILKVFPAYWNKYGKSAGPIRNRQMVEQIHGKEGAWYKTYHEKGNKAIIPIEWIKDMPIKE